MSNEQEDKYMDTAFPASQESLFDTNNTYLSSKLCTKWKSFAWMRAPEFVEADQVMLCQTIDPIDIIPSNSLLNSYFVSALCALSLFPDRVKALFSFNKLKVSNGFYVLNVYFAGKRLQIELDDMVPVDIKERQMAFIHTVSKDLWPVLAEKAWAKVNGSYERISNGTIGEALSFLTGSPYTKTIEHNTTNPEALWQALQISIKNHSIICATSERASLTLEEYGNPLGVPEYSFPIVEATEVTISKVKYRLILLMDPWDLHKWTGEWAVNSPSWTPEAKRILGYDFLADTHKFYIKLEDYLKFFSSTVICQAYSTFAFSEVEATQIVGDYALFKIIVEEPVEGCLCVVQKPKRVMGMKYSNYDISEVSMILGQLSNPLKYIKGDVQRSECSLLNFESPLEEGTYLLLVEINWNLEGLNSYSVNSYTSGKITLTTLDKSEYPDFIPHAMKSCAIQKSKQKTYEENGEPKIVKYTGINDSKANYGYIYYQNWSDSTILYETLFFKELKGIKIISQITNKKVTIELHPQQDYIVLLKKLKSGASYSTDTVTRIKFSEERLKEMLETKAKITKLIEDEIYFYSLPHDFGFVWCCKNKTANTIFGAKFHFEFNNLEFEKKPETDIFTTEIKPGNEDCRFIKIINPTQGSSFKFEYIPFLKDQEIDSRAIIAEMKEKTSPKQVKYLENLIQVNYYTYYKNGNYYWYFINNTDKQFKAKLTFTLNNLELHQPSGGDNKSWELSIMPQQDAFKFLKTIDFKSGVSYQAVVKVSLI